MFVCIFFCVRRCRLSDQNFINVVPTFELYFLLSDVVQQQYHNQQPMRNMVPPQPLPYPSSPQHLNHLNYVAPVMQPMYPPQGYQIPVAYAYPGQGDHYPAPFPSKLNQKAVIVTVSNYIPSAVVPQPVILQRNAQLTAPFPVTQPVPDHAALAVPPVDKTEATATGAAEASPRAGSAAAASPPRQNGTESCGGNAPNKSWASLFNKGDGGKKSVVVNGCAKPEETQPASEESDDEFAALKKDLKVKYDDPTFFRVGGESVQEIVGRFV